MVVTSVILLLVAPLISRESTTSVLVTSCELELACSSSKDCGSCMSVSELSDSVLESC